MGVWVLTDFVVFQYNKELFVSEWMSYFILPRTYRSPQTPASGVISLVQKKKKKDLVWPVSEALAYQEARTSLRCHVIKMITSSRLLRACDLVVFVISSLCLLCLRHVVFLGYFDEVAVLSRL